jgi:FKBP-type peptidyl-prolyl cis-trans isomerase FkpA
MSLREMKTFLKTTNDPMKIFRVILPFFLFLYVSCHNNNLKKQVAVPGKEDMTELNRYLVQKDREIIGNFIERKGFKMTESPTGLWYLVENEGSGRLFKDGDRIIIFYNCSLLDGTECYSSDQLGPMDIVLGKTDLAPGLTEGLKLLRPGSEAIFILPPYLAFGFVGDGKKIPPRSIIMYRITVKSPQ